tara:strand:+ start:1541 stop:1942 length:402 start_codon:yes stop_codon:yes gene_type:complete
MKVFVDTNVLVSAIASRGLSADVFQLILTEHDLITGEFVLNEFRRVLITKIKVPEEIVNEAEQLLRRYQIEPIPENPSQIKVRDEDDRWVLESAMQAEADVLITGDKDLLVISDQLVKPKIITPRQFWELVQK